MTSALKGVIQVVQSESSAPQARRRPNAASNGRRTTADRLAPRASRRAGASELPRLVDINEIAEHLGVTVRHVRRLVAERRIPYLKWGNLLRFDPQEIGEWLTGQCVTPLAPRARGRRAV